MNKMRRKKVADLMNRLSDLKDELDSIIEDEQEYVDNAPCSFQGTERYEEAEGALGNLNDAANILGDALDLLFDVAG